MLVQSSINTVSKDLLHQHGDRDIELAVATWHRPRANCSSQRVCVSVFARGGLTRVNLGRGGRGPRKGAHNAELGARRPLLLLCRPPEAADTGDTHERLDKNVSQAYPGPLEIKMVSTMTFSTRGFIPLPNYFQPNSNEYRLLSPDSMLHLYIGIGISLTTAISHASTEPLVVPNVYIDEQYFNFEQINTISFFFFFFNEFFLTFLEDLA